MAGLTASETVNVDEIYWRNQLLAIRHLRPGTPVTQPGGPLARQLFNDLLRLPDQHDPLLWLQRERGPAVALLMLGLIGDFAAQLQAGAQQLSHFLAEPATPSAHQQSASYLASEAELFGQLLTSPAPQGASTPWVERITATAGADQLVAEMSRLQQQSKLQMEPSPHRSQSEPGYKQLLADLLRVPETVDLLQWLQSERSDLSARYVLEYLLRQAFPPVNAFDEKPYTRPSLFPKAHSHISGRLSVSVDRLDFYEQGFAIHLHARISSKDAWRTSQRSTTVLPAQWQGFTSISDDLGHYYMTQLARCERSNQLWWWRERLTLHCYPAVGQAHTLLLKSQPAALALYRIPRLGDEIIPVPSPSLGEMSLTISLP